MLNLDCQVCISVLCFVRLSSLTMLFAARKLNKVRWKKRLKQIRQDEQIWSGLVLSCSRWSQRGHFSLLNCTSRQYKAVLHLFLSKDFVSSTTNTKKSDSLLFPDDFTAMPRYYANVRHILCNYKRSPLHKMWRVASSGLIIQSWLLSNFS